MGAPNVLLRAHDAQFVRVWAFESFDGRYTETQMHRKRLYNQSQSAHFFCSLQNRVCSKWAVGQTHVNIAHLKNHADLGSKDKALSPALFHPTRSRINVSPPAQIYEETAGQFLVPGEENFTVASIQALCCLREHKTDSVTGQCSH